MNKLFYTAPEVEYLDIVVESGFAGSQFEDWIEGGEAEI